TKTRTLSLHDALPISIPQPDKALKDCASLIETCSSDAAVMIACARGCSDNCSAEAAKDRTSSRLPSFAHTEVNFGFPSVRVPVYPPQLCPLNVRPGTLLRNASVCPAQQPLR